MAFKSLLLSKDAALVQTLTRLLKDLEIEVEPCSEPFTAAKRLMDQHFDAILVDCENEQGAGWVLQSARMATASKKSITIAIVDPQGATHGGARAGENFVIQKPVVLKQVESTLRAARGLMGEGEAILASETPAAPASTPAEKAATPVPSRLPSAAPGGQGRPPAELFDELTAVLDRLGPKGEPSKPVAAAPTSSGSAAAAAPALEKPTPAAPVWEKSGSPAPEPTSRQEPALPPVLRPAQQPWPGVATASSAPAKTEAATVLPLAATSVEMKTAMRPSEEQVRSNDALDNVRRRMNSSAPPAWRTEVEERQEVPAPRFSTYASEEEPRKGFPFKAIAVAMVLLSFALFGYSWYRERHNATGPAPQAPAAMPQQQPAEMAPINSPPSATPASPNSSLAQNSPAEAENSSASGTRTTPHTPKPAAVAIAPDTTTEVMPPAPLVVRGGKKHASPSPQETEAQIAPPSLATVAGAAKPGLGGVVSATPVDLPQLAPAAPTRVQVSQGVTQGLLVRQVKPQYPSMARETRVQGDVLLDAVISKDGTVTDLKVVSGPGLLIPPALQAVRQWRYKPYLLNGQPVEVETRIKLQFRL